MANAKVLGQVAAFVQELAIPWLIIGDFQVPPLQWEGHNLLSVLRAEVVSGGQPTMINGAEIDYIAASRVIAPFPTLKVNWDVPWKPHAGLEVHVGQEAPRLPLQQLTHFAPIPKLEVMEKTWDQFEPAPKPFWLGRPVGPKQIQCAEFCHQAEQFALQHLHQPRFGRGWYLALEIKPLAKTKPLTPWRRGDLAYWGQMSSLLHHAAKKATLSVVLAHLKAKATDLQSRWQDIHGLADFQEGLTALINGAAEPAPTESWWTRWCELLPEGVTDLCNMYRRWELEGRLPDQVRTTLVLLLPKKADIERPISLTSVLYRTWCRLRWDKLRPWQRSIGHKLTWERSVPGTHVLQVALMRLLKCEVGRATGKHVVSLLVDLQCFYDSVELEQLLRAWEPLHLTSRLQ